MDTQRTVRTRRRCLGLVRICWVFNDALVGTPSARHDVQASLAATLAVPTLGDRDDLKARCAVRKE